jgi:hypothetical protein
VGRAGEPDLWAGLADGAGWPELGGATASWADGLAGRWWAGTLGVDQISGPGVGRVWAGCGPGGPGVGRVWAGCGPGGPGVGRVWAGH